MVKSRRRSGKTTDLSLASMSDIAFLLIIFFMVASSFMLHEGFFLVLPDKTSKSIIKSRNEVITITLRESGVLTLNDKKATIRELSEELMDIAGNGRDKRVILSVEKKAAYHLVIGVMEQVSSAGLKNLNVEMI